MMGLAIFNQNANQSIPLAASWVSAGLQSATQSIAKIAAHLRNHPSELQAMAEKAEAVHKQLGDLIDRTSKFAESASELQGTVGEVTKASDWVGDNFSNGGGGGGGHVQTFHVDNGAFAALWQKHGT